MPKFRVAYVAVNHELTVRQHASGIQETLDDRISFRKEESPAVEAKDEQTARDMVRMTLPVNVEFTAQVTRLPDEYTPAKVEESGIKPGAVSIRRKQP